MRRSSLVTLLLSAAVAVACAQDGNGGRGGGGGVNGEDDGTGGTGGGATDDGSGDGGEGDGGGGGDDTGGGDGTGGTASDDGDTTSDCEPFCPEPDQPDVEEDDCGGTEVDLEPLPANVLLVLDLSGSMFYPENYWDHDADPGTPTISRWHSVHNVVTFIVDNYDDVLNLGALLFPTYNGGSCDVAAVPEVPVAPTNGANILATIPPANADTDGATPLPTALSVGYDHVVTLDPMIPRAVILVSDGAPTCLYPISTAVTYAGDAFNNDGIPTYVVGIAIDGTTQTGYNNLAVAGGVPNPNGPDSFYNAQNEVELQTALDAIAVSVISCIVPLDPPPDDPELVDIQINGVSIPQVTDCATEDGWVYVNPNGPYNAIEICGSYCDEVKQDGATVSAIYGCPPPD